MKQTDNKLTLELVFRHLEIAIHALKPHLKEEKKKKEEVTKKTDRDKK